MPTVLFAPDLASTTSAASREWILSVCSMIQSLGYEVAVHPRERHDPELGAALADMGALLMPYRVGNPSHEDATGQLARYRARGILSTVKQLNPKWVVAQGLSLCRYLAGGKGLARTLWAMPLDSPYRNEPLSRETLEQLPLLSDGARRLIVNDEEQRAVLEATCPPLTSRVALLPLPSLDGAAPSSGEQIYNGSVIINLDFFQNDSLPNLEGYAMATRELRQAPKVFLAGTGDPEIADLPLWSELAGRQLITPSKPDAKLGLVPAASDPVARRLAIRHYRRLGALPIAVDDPSVPAWPGLARLTSGEDLAQPELVEAALAHADDPPLDTATDRMWLPHAPIEAPTQSATRKLRVVVAGADFKFAGDLIQVLAEVPDIDLRIDLFEANAKIQPNVSSAYVEWADIVIAEFASKNAIWYSHNIRPGQQLIVHLHGYELLHDWIDELQIDSCAAIVVASDFYRQKALDLKAWPADKVRVIPNSASPEDLQRDKLPDARFHIGFAGYVPILKRPDRALDLLSILRDQDDRYTLHMRGHSPWNYNYEWKKSAHQDAYREFYGRLGSSSQLMAGVSFEGFSPDMGNWLRKIGWMLSTSYRETFHLAGIEGAMSGAVPLVWEREGSLEIYSRRWNFSSTEEVANFVLMHNTSAETFRSESVRAQSFAERYSAPTVTDQWVHLVRELAEIAQEHTFDPLGQDSVISESSAEEALLHEVDQALLDNSYELALESLDANIPVTTKATSKVKHAELWVRGVAALDSRRYWLFHPRRPSQSIPFGEALMVRRAGESSLDLTACGLERDLFDISDYPYSDPLQAPLQGPGDTLSPYNAGTAGTPGTGIRADRWLELLSSEIVAIILRRGLKQVIARGPWWVALPAAMAADRLGIPFSWVITDPIDVKRAESAVALPYTAGFIEQLALLIASHADRLLDETSELKGSLLAAHVRAVESMADGPSAIPSNRDIQPPHEYGGIPNSVAIPLNSVSVLAAGHPPFIESWREAGVDIQELTVADVGNDVDPNTDLVVVDAALSSDPQWAPCLHGETPQATTAIGQLFDRARAIGARSIMATQTLGKWPDALLASIRKVDTLVFENDADAQSLLTMHPISLERAIKASSLQPWTASPEVFLRMVGLQVALPHAPSEPAEPWISHPSSEDFDHQPHTAQHAGADDQLEGISIVLATDKGPTGVVPILESLKKQSLPQELVQLVVVDHGETPAALTVLQEFVQQTGMAVTYRFREDLSIGAAWNAGLAECLRAYVTFVNDGDRLESDCLLGMWLSAASNAVVVAPVVDIDSKGLINRNTPATQRVQALGSGRIPLEFRAGLLEGNTSKLIPRSVAQQYRYPEDLLVGEDVVYMSKLLDQGLEFVAAAPLKQNAYVNSIDDDPTLIENNRSEMLMYERLRVVSQLEAVKHDRSRSASSAVNFLQKHQAEGAVAFILQHPHLTPHISQLLSRYRLTDLLRKLVPGQKFHELFAHLNTAAN